MERRSYMLRVRLDKNDKDKLDRDCKKAELDASKYIRKLINGENILSAPTIDFYEFINELNHIGTNLNQLTKKANKGEYDHKKIDEVLDDLKRLIATIKKEVLG